MKKLRAKNLLLCGTLSLIAILISCGGGEDPQVEKFGQVKFAFSDEASNSRLNSEDASAVVVSMTDASGESVFLSEEFTLYNFDGYKVSEAFSLPVGSYEITEYHIIDDAANILFSAPLVGSALEYLVDNALPLSFSVTKDEAVTISPDVLSIDNFTPEDFGYVSFAFKIVETIDVLVSALIFNLNPLVLDYELTSANIVITDGVNQLYNGSLEAITNEVTLRGDKDTYVVTITKDGYATFTQTYSGTEFQAFSEDPLSVILELI